MRDTDPSVDVKFGQLKLQGSVGRNRACLRIDLIVRYLQIGCSKIFRAKYCCRQDGDPAAETCCPRTHQGTPFTPLLVVSQSYLYVQSVLLVGGFAASNWLFHELQTHLAGTGLRLYRPDGHLYV